MGCAVGSVRGAHDRQARLVAPRCTLCLGLPLAAEGRLMAGLVRRTPAALAAPPNPPAWSGGGRSPPLASERDPRLGRTRSGRSASSGQAAVVPATAAQLHG